MVVDVDHEPARGRSPVPSGADPTLVRAVDREQHALVDVGRELAHDLVEIEEAVLGRQRRGAGEDT